ncbi:MAG: shikimate kinase [Dehalococcoidia bacterium]
MAVVGRRVVVYGPSGSGKSTLARALAERLGVPVVELDAIYHARPGWDDLSRDEFRDAVATILARETGGWVIEGNYGMVRDLILPLADTAVWLRLPFRTVYPRLVRRTIGRGLRRELLWGSNRESLRMAFFTRDSMLLWGISHWRTGIRNTAADLARIPHHARVVELRSPRAVREFLAYARA